MLSDQTLCASLFLRGQHVLYEDVVMLVYVEIPSDEVEEKQGVSERGVYHTRRQVGYIHQGEAYPEKVTLNLGSVQAYPAGRYLLGQSSFRRDQFGFKLQSQLNLVPVSDAIKALQALSTVPAKVA